MSTRFLAAGLVLAAACLVGCNEPKRFEQADFSDPANIQKNAGNYWKREGWWGGMSKDVKKVAITQFNVEYVTENISKSGADALSVLGVLEMGGMGKRQRQFPDDFKKQFPTQLYNGFVEALKAEGLEVATMSEVQNTAAFKEFKAGEAGKSGSASGRDLLGRADNSQQVKFQVYPAEGLPLLDDGFLGTGAATNMQAEGKVIGDTGAQVGLRVRMRVALTDDGHAVLDKGAGILVSYDLAKENWSGKGPEWIVKQRANLTASGAMRDDVPVATKKDFEMFKGDIYTIDGSKFQASILKMYPTFARMAVVKLKS
jgi:hypothetical protein